jgi:hypothetical protein|tara:strand:- start:615 stop:728 length:114 start_codon:yes stop_codon:yes gene_type:complete
MKLNAELLEGFDKEDKILLMKLMMKQITLEEVFENGL